MKTAQVVIGNSKHDVSPLLFGLFLEDINFSCDGGLNSNLVENYSFGGEYPEKGYTMMKTIMTKKAPKIFPDRLRYWQIEQGTISSMEGAPGRSNWFAQVDSLGKCTLRNNGFNGHGSHADACAMNIVQGHTYSFNCYLRNHSFKGTISIWIEDQQGNKLTSTASLSYSNQWNQEKTEVQALKNAYGRLVISFDGVGKIDIDCVVFSDTEVWGKDDPKWSQTHLRIDMVEVLRDLKPTFLRFPGGCIVEGLYDGNEYNWKDTIGNLIDRKEKLNLWSAGVKDKGYTQSYQIGFYEYFLLCEDLNMEPLPTLWAGLNCQFRSKDHLETDSEDFKKRVVQSYLDLIEFANGDPATNEWAKIRAQMGHPEPFNMKLIGIGNENHGEEFLEKFGIIKAEIDKKYPGMTCILSSGAFPDDKPFNLAWDTARAKFQDVNVDEHFYKPQKWFYQQVNRYDNYKRNTAKVFVGEYASNFVTSSDKANIYATALAEAAFLTGVERNSDVVAMTCYAPLFCFSSDRQWKQNLIDFNPKAVVRSTNYFVQQMYGQHQGTRVVAFEGQLPKNVYLSVTETADKYILKLVNAAASKRDIDDVAVSVQVKAQDGPVVGTILQTDDLNAVNSIDYDSSPKYEVQPKPFQATVKNHTLSIVAPKQSFIVVELNK